MLNTKSLLALSAAVVLSFPLFASADQIISIPDYAGTNGPFPSATPISIGNFSFVIPADEQVIGATISGTWGNEILPGTTDTSASSDLYVDGGLIEVAECDDAQVGAPCDTSGEGPVAWSYTFTSGNLSNLATELATGSIDFTAIQNGFGEVNTGDVTLDINTTPEPSSICLMGLGLVSLALVKRFAL